MSLINDALKKAQRQRHGEPTPPSAPPSAPATPPPPPSALTPSRSKPAARPTQFLLVGAAGAALALLLAVGGYFLFVAEPAPSPTRPSSPVVAQTPAPAQPATVRPAEPAAGPTPPPTAAATIPASVLPAASPAAVTPPPLTAVAQEKITAPSQPTTTPAVATTTPAALVAVPATPPVVAATPPASPVTETPASRPKPSARMISVIHNLEITGIRVAGTDSRVLMNNKVVKIGDVIDAEIGLRLTGVAKGALTFEDNRGATYTRTL